MSEYRALIVDDNPNNLGVLVQLLTIEGIDATGLQDPARLSAVLKNASDFDVVFVDLEMPGVDGYSVLDHLRADKRFQETPIVAYTVHTSEINAARNRGFHSFLAKPLDAERFPDQLSRILRGEPVWSVQ
jgi:CheY-like chemotaxis protein